VELRLRLVVLLRLGWLLVALTVPLRRRRGRVDVLLLLAGLAVHGVLLVVLLLVGGGILVDGGLARGLVGQVGGRGVLVHGDCRWC
jgi:hypothetical protein